MKLKLTIYFSIFLLGLTLASSASAAITLRPSLNLGLVGYWSMDEGAGTQAGDSSGNGNVASFPGTNVETFTTSGSTSWQASAGTDSVQVELWGGGADGGVGNWYVGGDGGGGGAYSKKNSVNVTPGNSYTVYVGAANTDSYFNDTSTVLAKAGSGFMPGSTSNSIGDVKYAGGEGELGTDTCEGGGGSSAGTSSNGNPGGSCGMGGSAPAGGGAGGNYQLNGSVPGGGGGGTSPVGPAGAGAAGKAILTYSTGTNPDWTDGKRDKALSFDGTFDYISAGNVGSGIKTVSFWLKADDLTSRKIMDFDGTDQIEINSSSQITATSFPGTTIIYVDGAVASTVDSNWHFVTITDTTGVNGSAVDIGRVASGYFDGMIDEVRFYSRVLSPTEVTSLYQSGAAKFKMPNNLGLVGYWSMEEGTGTQAGDSSGNGKTASFPVSGVETFTTPGSGSWQAPAGVTSVQVEAWGGGGNGGTGSQYWGGPGGGGGAYSKKNSVSVIPGNSYTVYIGAANTDSYFIDISTVLAKGGSSYAINPGQAASSIGDIKYSGGSGEDSTEDCDGGGGSSAGTSTDGNSGGSCGVGGSAPAGGGAGGNTGTEGSAPGGGGGGGLSPSGAPGQIVLTYSSGTPPTWVDGKRGKALSFNGTDNFVSHGNVGSGIKTVSFWLKADDLTSRKIMDFDGTDQIEINSSSQITATSFPGTTIIYVDGAVASTVDSNWHFVTITDTTGVNGSAVDIGRVASGYFDGMIDEVRMYNNVLSPTEVANLYTSSGKKTTINSSQNSQLTSGLVGLWSFNGPDVNMTTNTAYDRAGSNNGTISGATPAIGKVGQGMSFNGSSNYVSTALNIDQSSGHTATFCAWVNPASTSSSYHSVVSTDNGGSDWTLERNGAYWGVMEGNSHSVTTLSADSNTWQHICAVYDSTDVKFYKNSIAQIIGDTLLSLDITANADDGYAETLYTFGVFYSSQNNMNVGGNFSDPDDLKYNASLRFLNATIPKDAVINSAALTLTAYSTQSDLASPIIVRGDDADSSPALGIIHYCDYSTWASTSANVSWNIGAVTAGTKYVSSDIKSIIAEITSRAGWSSGGALSLGLYGSSFGSSVGNHYNFTTHDYGSATDYPQLDVSYSTPLSYDTSDNNVSIGRNPQDSEYFDGKIDEVRAYDRALSAGEIGQLYNMGR